MKRKICSWALVVLWMALIFYFSHQPAAESNRLSTGIIEKVIEVVENIVPAIQPNPDNFNHIIRKAAHFSVYLVLGALVSNGLITGGKSERNSIILALSICVLYAVSDEIHQLFIPGRSGELRDVIIDSAGGLVGIIGFYSIRGRFNRKDRKR